MSMCLMVLMVLKLTYGTTEQHNQIVRNNIDIYKGYEVSFVNNSFMIAFAALDDAINFTAALQISLLHIEGLLHFYTNQCMYWYISHLITLF